jgi:hypothetical protein
VAAGDGDDVVLVARALGISVENKSREQLIREIMSRLGSG